MTDKADNFSEPKTLSILDTIMGENWTAINIKQQGAKMQHKTKSYEVISHEAKNPTGVKMRHSIVGRDGHTIVEAGQNICPSFVLRYGGALYFLADLDTRHISNVLSDYKPGSVIIIKGSSDEKGLSEKYNATFYYDGDEYYNEKYGVLDRTVKIIKPYIYSDPIIVPL